MSDAVTLLGSGGSEFVFDLPLRANFVKQLERGQLRPATAADAAKLAGTVPPEDTVADGAELLEEEQDAEPAVEVVERPPGNGSTDAWRAYADQVGVAVDDDATRDEIRDAVEAAGL